MLLRRRKLVPVALFLGALAFGASGSAAPPEVGDRVTTVRVPNDGIQPQVAVDGKGVVHLLYFKGDPGGGDVFYTRAEGGKRFGAPLRVNSQPGSVVAVGNI